MVIDAVVQTRAHPVSAHQWYLTAEGIEQLVADLPGMLVQRNYQGEPVGKVLAAERLPDGVKVQIEVVDPQVAKTLEGYVYGPALHNPDSRPQLPAGEYPMGRDWRAKTIGAVDPTPKPEAPIVGEVPAEQAATG